MIGALLYLRINSLRNLVAYRVRRLRQPRYLIGAAAGAAYIYFWFLRRLRFSGAQGAPGPAGMAAAFTAVILAAICAFMSALALLRIAFAWISPPPTPGLQFSEAEIAFLFPAPLERRMLIHFRLLSAQLAILLTSVLTTVVFSRIPFAGGNGVMRAAGFWVVLSTFSLSLAGTNLAVARLKDRSSHYLLWRVAVVAAMALYAAAVLWSAVRFMNLDSSGRLFTLRGMGGLVPGLLASSPLRWLILPFGIVFAPYFSGNLAEFTLAMVPALGVLALLYHWVSSSEYRFEEGSIALAEKRAAFRATMLRGEAPKVGIFKPKAQPGPFPLSPTGPPEVAFLWKNLLSMRSTLMNRRTIIMAFAMITWVALAFRPLLARGGGPASYGLLIAIFCAIAACYTLLIGPQAARQDLRSDLPNADILKTFPLESWRLALGELLAPAAVLSLVLWALIIISSIAMPTGGLEWLTPGVRLAVALCLCAAAPVVCVVQLIVPNLIMVLLPAWYQASRSRGGGIELFGQRLVLGVAQMLASLLVIAPGVVVASLIIFSAHIFIGLVPAIALAALVVLPVMAGEAAVGLWWIGERFDRFDLSTEIK
jgi:ABC-2 type transport system permease protein